MKNIFLKQKMHLRLKKTQVEAFKPSSKVWAKKRGGGDTIQYNIECSNSGTFGCIGNITEVLSELSINKHLSFIKKNCYECFGRRLEITKIKDKFLYYYIYIKGKPLSSFPFLLTNLSTISFVISSGKSGNVALSLSLRIGLSNNLHRFI